MPEQFSDYLRSAGEQIRWKRARPLVLSELRTHLLDQRDDCLAQGMTEEDAQAEALRQMGDPVTVGTELDGVHRPRPQWGPLLMTLAVALAGASLRVGLTAGWDRGLMIDPVRTALAMVLGAAVLLGGYFLDYTCLGRHAAAVYGGTVLASLLSLGVSPRITGVSYLILWLRSVKCAAKLCGSTRAVRLSLATMCRAFVTGIRRCWTGPGKFKNALTFLSVALIPN